MEKYNRFLKIKIIKKRKNGRRKKKDIKKENATELQKPSVEAEVYNNNKKCDWIYTYTYTPIHKIKTVQQKYSILTRWTKETKSFIYQNNTE